MGFSGDTNGLQSGFLSSLEQLGAVCNIGVGSGFRTHEQQAALYAEKGAYSSSHAGAAPPGHSHHELGLAVDLTGDIACAHAHAAQFGLRFPMANEDWHIEPTNLTTDPNKAYPAPAPHPTDPVTNLDTAQKLLFGNQDPSIFAPSREEVAAEATHHLGQMDAQSAPLDAAARTAEVTKQQEKASFDPHNLLTDAGQPTPAGQAAESSKQQQKAGLLAASGGGGGGAGGGQIDAFMAAERQKENGGNYNWNTSNPNHYGAYQFAIGTWLSAAASAGLNPNDHSQANQDAVARHLMLSYYESFGHDWHKVAEAWFGGPGMVGHSAVQGYADDIVRSMGAGGAAPSQPADQALATPTPPSDPTLPSLNDLIGTPGDSGPVGRDSLKRFGR